MIALLRRIFGPSEPALNQRLTLLEARLAEWEVTMTGLTDKLSTQLKRMAAREGRRGHDSEAARVAELNEAIRLRRRPRLSPFNGGE